MTGQAEQPQLKLSLTAELTAPGSFSPFSSPNPKTRHPALQDDSVHVYLVSLLGCSVHQMEDF